VSLSFQDKRKKENEIHHKEKVSLCLCVKDTRQKKNKNIFPPSRLAFLAGMMFL